MIRDFDMMDGRVVVKYDTETREILDICDWNGNEVSDRIVMVAEERISEMRTSCLECVSSCVPGRHYNNNDETSGQSSECPGCNGAGTIGV